MKDVTLLFATFLASAEYKMYHYVTEYVEKFTGIPTLLLNGEDLDDFSAGYVDAGFIAASDYAYLSNLIPNPVERIARPLMCGLALPNARPNAEPEGFRVVVRRESPYYGLADLQQSIFSYCFRGYFSHAEPAQDQSLEQTLLASSSSLLSLCGKIETASPMQALRLVLAGQADAAVVEERVLDLILRNSAVLSSNLRTLGLERVPRVSDVVVATQLDEGVKRAVREAFRTIHQEPFFAQRLHASSIEQFQVVEQKQPAIAQYESIETHVTDPEQVYAFHW